MATRATFALLLVVACGRAHPPAAASDPAPPPVAPAPDPVSTVTVTPGSAVMMTGSSFKFGAIVTGARDGSINWSAPSGGAIDPTGLYIAPNTPGTYRVVASSRVSPGSSGEAQVIVTPGPEDLVDHGGEILPAPTTYAVFWGPPDSFPNDEQSTVENILKGVSSSSLWTIVDEYMRGDRARATFGGNLHDPTQPPSQPPGTGEVAAEICLVLDAAGLKASTDAVYFLFPSSGFMLDSGSACAWHSAGTCHGTAIHTVLIPNPTTTSCSFVPRRGCSQGSGISQSIANLTVHELVESLTDPLGSAWTDEAGQEIASKCIAERACALIGDVLYDMQRFWSNAAHSCALPSP